MKVILDRFEGNYAVVEMKNGKNLNVPKELFINANEGDIIEITVLKEETIRQKEAIDKLASKLFEE